MIDTIATVAIASARTLSNSPHVDAARATPKTRSGHGLDPKPLRRREGSEARKERARKRRSSWRTPRRRQTTSAPTRPANSSSAPAGRTTAVPGSATTLRFHPNSKGAVAGRPRRPTPGRRSLKRSEDHECQKRRYQSSMASECLGVCVSWSPGLRDQSQRWRPVRPRRQRREARAFPTDRRRRARRSKVTAMRGGHLSALVNHQA